MRGLLSSVLLFTIFLPLISLGQMPVHIAQATPPRQENVNAQVAALMEDMTLQQKVGQLFMVTFYSPELLERQEIFLREYQPGAIALFGSNLDYQSAAQTTVLVNNIQQAAVESGGIPMIVAVDQEGGGVWRLINGFTHFPDPLYIGATNDPELAFQLGQAVGREVSAVGVNMNLAPVVDLHVKEDELNKYRVLHQRTLGQHPDIVGEMAGAMTQGMAEAGVIGVIKHFPGHNPTAVDTHRDLATVTMDRETFDTTNGHAFKVAIENGAPVVMMGHLYYADIEPIPNLPASLSSTMINILRQDYGFDGVIMSDALDMGAIANNFPVDRIGVLALQAGVDLMAMGPHMTFSNQQLIMDRVYTAVLNGEVSEERLNEAVARVLTLKAEYGLLTWQELNPATAEERIQPQLSSQAILRAFESAITVVKDETNTLPIGSDDNVLFVYPIGMNSILEECSLHLPNADFQGFSYAPADWEFSAVATKVRNADVVVSFGENLHNNRRQSDILSISPPEKTIFVALGTPYDVEWLGQPPAGLVLGYNSTPEALTAICRVLAGAVPARGVLPVNLDGFIAGESITYDASLPEDSEPSSEAADVPHLEIDN
jgi:beta-N-acetylhexosaminidase